MTTITNTLAMLLIVLFIAPLDAMAADKQQLCNDYATKAVEQYNLGKQHKLPGVVPPAWSNDRNGHYNWCMAVPENFANSENTKRQAYLDQHIAKAVPGKQAVEGMATGKVVGNGGSAVSATPISIPRPMKVEKLNTKVAINKIERMDLLSLDQNVMHIRLRYKVDPSFANKLYAGAFLYDANLKAINAGYKPTQEQNSPEGSIDLYLVLPSERFQSATLETFLMHSGKVIGKKYFKFPFMWDGTYGIFVKSGHHTLSELKVTPSEPKLGDGWGELVVPAEHGLPIGLDPAIGP